MRIVARPDYPRATSEVKTRLKEQAHCFGPPRKLLISPQCINVQHMALAGTYSSTAAPRSRLAHDTVDH